MKKSSLANGATTFPLMIGTKIAIRNVLVKVNAWPVPVSFSYSFKNSIEELKTNLMLYYPNVTRDISLHNNAVELTFATSSTS